MHRTSGRPWHKETIRTSFAARETPSNHFHEGVSKNNGTPKSSILIRFSIINHPFWGNPIFGNTHFHDTFRYPDTAPNLYRITHCHLRFRHWGDTKSKWSNAKFQHCFFLEFSSLIFFELVVFHQPIWKKYAVCRLHLPLLRVKMNQQKYLKKLHHLIPI